MTMTSPETTVGAGVQLTERDLALIEFTAAHRFVLAAHAQAFMATGRVPAYRRLGGLVRAGLLDHRRLFATRPGVYLAERAGLAVIESTLPPATIDLRSYRHDLLLVALWIDASRHPGARVFSERQIRQADRFSRYRRATVLDETGSGPRLHYPDVLIEVSGGDCLAVELELSLKSRRRLEHILIGYGSEQRIRKVLYVTDLRVIEDAVTQTAAEVGLTELVDVRYTGRRLTVEDALPGRLRLDRLEVRS